MSDKLLSPEDVLHKIGATDFRSITKNQLVDFVSTIPDMDKEVAIKCIEQFPEFTKHSKIIIDQLYSVCNQVIVDHKDMQISIIENYKSILDDLRELLKNENISEEQQRYIMDRMVEIANKIDYLAQDHTNFLKHVLNCASGVASIALTIAGAVIGVKLFNKK